MGIADVVLASSTGTGIAMAIGGIIAVIAISAVFYLVGRGEDREREQAAQARAAEAEDQPEPPPAAEPPAAAASAAEPPAAEPPAAAPPAHDERRARPRGGARSRRRR